MLLCVLMHSNGLGMVSAWIKNKNMINIKLYKNEIELIRESIQSSKWFGNEPKLCDRLLKKLDKKLTIPVVVGQSEQLPNVQCTVCGRAQEQLLKYKCTSSACPH